MHSLKVRQPLNSLSCASTASSQAHVLKHHSSDKAVERTLGSTPKEARKAPSLGEGGGSVPGMEIILFWH